MEKKKDQIQQEYAEFIEIAAHDLDAPLRKLSLLIDMVTQKFSNTQKEEVQSHITRINTSLTDMRSLIDGLATLSKLISTPLKMETLNPELILNEIKNELGPKVTGGAVIRTSSLHSIKGDEAQFKLLFRNLIENALRFNKNEKKEICVESGEITREEIKNYGLRKDIDYSKITIYDNGIGFNQEDAERIFRPFVRLHGKSEYPDTGLGLAMCKKIVENHQGIIYAESNENEGARFILILPQIFQKHAEPKKDKSVDH